MPITDTAKNTRETAKPADQSTSHADAAQQAQAKLAADAIADKQPKAGDKKSEAKPADNSFIHMLEHGKGKLTSLLWDTANYILPPLTIIHGGDAEKAVIKKEEGMLDLTKLVSDSCSSGNSCKADSSVSKPSGLAGFEFVKNQATESGDRQKMESFEKTLLSKADLAAVNQCFTEAQCKADSKQTLAPILKDLGKDNLGHKNADGQVDAVRHGDTTVFRGPNGEITTAELHGIISRLDKNGERIFQMAPNGHFIGKMENGLIADIDPSTNTMRVLDKEGKPVTEIHNGKTLAVIGKFQGGQVTMTTEEITSEQLPQTLRDLKELAKTSGEMQTRTFTNGQYIVYPDGTVMGVQMDGTATLSVADDKYLVRKPDGSFELYTDGKAGPEKLSESEAEETLRHHHVDAAIISATLRRMRKYARCHQLDGDHETTVSLDGDKIKSNVSGVMSTEQSETSVKTTDLQTGKVIETDLQSKTVTVDDGHGSKTTIQAEQNPQHGFKFQGTGYQYDNGKVTTANGDVFQNGDIHFANGNEYHKDGTTTFADGSTFQSYDAASRQSAQSQQVEAARKSQAVNMASYAEGLAGALRSKAASGHATASDIAALESAYSSICSAVMSLGAECDPGARVKLMMAQGDIGSSIDASLASLHNKPRVQAA